MTISARLEASHNRSFISPVKMMFKVVLVPEKLSTASGLHYIIVIDKSGSMSGSKITNAKLGAVGLIRKIPPGNKVSLITFSNRVQVLKEFSDPVEFPELEEINANGATALFSALSTAFTLHRRYNIPSYIVILTDGNPTDNTNVDTYRKMDLPQGAQIISLGLGDDYNESILKTLADRTGGLMHHLEDPTEVPERLVKVAKTSVAAMNLKVDFMSESPVTLLNFSGPPVTINALEGAVKIYGECVIPPKYSGNFLTVQVKYQEPSGQEQNIVKALSMTPASNVTEFSSSINRDVIMEYEYYKNLQKMSTEVEAGNLTEATRALRRMEEIAEQTRRPEMIEATRRLSDGLQRAEGSVEETRKFSKEVNSEVTRRLRGEGNS
jgi:Uncharacterized protein containing a von Willebrand factor type A (vWA) domain